MFHPARRIYIPGALFQYLKIKCGLCEWLPCLPDHNALFIEERDGHKIVFVYTLRQEYEFFIVNGLVHIKTNPVLVGQAKNIFYDGFYLREFVRFQLFNIMAQL